MHLEVRDNFGTCLLLTYCGLTRLTHADTFWHRCYLVGFAIMMFGRITIANRLWKERYQVSDNEL